MATVSNSISWKILSSTTKDVAWKILTSTTKDVAWGIRQGISLDIAWRIQPALTVDVAWRLKAGMTKNIAWKIKNNPDLDIAWKILEIADEIPGVNTHEAIISVGGVEIKPAALTLRTDLDSLAWAATIRLATQADYDLCTEGASIIATLDSVSWHLKINKRDKSRAFPDDGWTVSAASPFAAVFEESFSLVLSADTLASDVAAEIVGSAVALSWRAYNWVLPAGLKFAENSTRRSVLGELVLAIGAVVASTSTGDLIVMPGTPIDEIYKAEWDETDIISFAIVTTPQEGYARVLAGSEGLHIPREISISVLSQDDVTRNATLGVWVSPDPVPPTLSCCGGLTITRNADHSEAKTETVIFRDGVAALGNVATITNVDWGSCTDLGNVTILSDGTLLADISGDSIADITFTTLYFEYLAIADGTGELDTMVCVSVPPVRCDIIADCKRGSGVLALSLDVLTHKFCTTLPAAAERGRVYLDQHTSDAVKYNINKLWSGGKLPEIGSLISFCGEKTRLASMDISYIFPAVAFTATLEVLP